MCGFTLVICCGVVFGILTWFWMFACVVSGFDFGVLTLLVVVFLLINLGYIVCISSCGLVSCLFTWWVGWLL